MNFECVWVHLYLLEAAMLVYTVSIFYDSHKIDHFDYSCDKFMKFEFFYEK